MSSTAERDGGDGASLVMSALSLDITRSRSRLNDVASVDVNDLGPQYNLINVLGATQSWNLDFLPIDWQSGLDELGVGGTASIQEFSVSRQLSFAYKLIKPRHSEAATEKELELARRRAFRAIVCEISVLGLFQKTAHPYISHLYGIAWDVESDDEIWPVLVSKKSIHGDLEKFLLSEEGQTIAVKEKVRLCAEVAIAIRDMHSYRKYNGGLSLTDFVLTHVQKSFMVTLTREI